MGKHKFHDPELDGKISVLYAVGKSMADIGRQLTLSPGYVYRSLERTNTPKRSISEAHKLRREVG